MFCKYIAYRICSQNVSHPLHFLNYWYVVLFPVPFSYLKKSAILEETRNISVRSHQSRRQMALPLLLPQDLIMLPKKPLVRMRRKRKYRPCRALILLSRMKLSLISSKCLQDQFVILSTLLPKSLCYCIFCSGGDRCHGLAYSMQGLYQLIVTFHLLKNQLY